MNTISKPTDGFRQHRSVRARAGQAEGFLVLYDDSLSGNAALRAALERAKPETEILAVYCIPLEEKGLATWQSLEMRANTYLAAARTNAALRGKAIKTQILPCQTLGAGLVEQAERWSADNIFLGDADGAEDGKIEAVADYVRRYGPAQVTLVKA